MNATHFIRKCATFLLLAGLMAAPTLGAKEKPAPALYLSISVPPVWDSLREADIADSFHGRIAEALRSAGFVGEITSLDRFDNPTPSVPVIAITLMEWRADRTGGVVCTFSANLKQNGSDKSLGIFTGTSPQWMTTASRTWELRRGLDDSAASAIRSMVRKLQDEKFLPPAKNKKEV